MNFQEIHFFQFTPKNSPEIDLDIRYAKKFISKADDTEFLGTYVDNNCHGRTILNKLHTYSVPLLMQCDQSRPSCHSNTVDCLLWLFSISYKLWIIILGELCA
jgi:hypothetical protein